MYGLIVEGVALSFTAICAWSTRMKLFVRDVRSEAARAATWTYAGGALAIVGAIGLSFISALLALAVHLAIAAFFLIAPGPLSAAFA